MTNDLKPIHNWDDHAAAMIELERVWGAPGGTPDGDRLEILATKRIHFRKTF